MTDTISKTMPPGLGATAGTGRLGSLFEAMSPSAAEALRARFHIRGVPAGAVVVHEGEHAEEVGFVLRGCLGMVKVLPDDRRHVIGLLVPTDRFGRIFDGPSSFQLEALSAARLACIDRESFEDLLRTEPEAERKLLVHLLDELDAAREWVLLIGGVRVIERVASFLLILLRRLAPSAASARKVIAQPLSRRDLAHFLGTRRESISRALHELQNEGVLRILTPDTFEIRDVARLHEIAGQDLVLDEPECRRA